MDRRGSALAKDLGDGDFVLDDRYDFAIVLAQPGHGQRRRRPSDGSHLCCKLLPKCLHPRDQGIIILTNPIAYFHVDDKTPVRGETHRILLLCSRNRARSAELGRQDLQPRFLQTSRYRWPLCSKFERLPTEMSKLLTRNRPWSNLLHYSKMWKHLRTRFGSP